jgi:hypothetical protein
MMEVEEEGAVSEPEQAAPRPTAAAATEGASPQLTASGKARCNALSAKGEQCKRSAYAGEGLCWLHLPPSKRDVPKENNLTSGEAAIGRRVRVYWRDQRQYYTGTVRGYTASGNKHHVVYDDGDTELLNLSLESFEWLAQAPAAEETANAAGQPRATRAGNQVCDAKKSLGDADSSLGDAKRSLGDAKSSLGDVHRVNWQTRELPRWPRRRRLRRRRCV